MKTFNEYWDQSRAARLPEATAYFLKEHIRAAWNAGREAARKEAKAKPVTF